MTSIRRQGWTALALLALLGCEAPAPPATTPPPAAPGPAAPGPAEPKKEADAAKLSDTEIAEIKKLPEAEQASALAQISCPVSGALLGKMGTPIKQKIGDKTFYICCDGCEDEIKTNPKGVLAKLNK